jgi:hypothetical protein
MVGEMSHAPCCCCCGQPFQPRPQNPTQTFCSQPACQRARKRAWQRSKRATDPDYRANDQAAQRAWAQAHPGYWRAWRERHPESVVRNREAQGRRNARRRGALGVIAKEDAWTSESCLPAGTYRVEPWPGTDCKCGRVNRENLFVLSAVEAI